MDRQLEYLIEGVEQNRQVILDTERYLWKNPESGYREWKTNRYLADILTGLGYELTFAGDIPGFYTVIDTGRPGPTVALFAEMDSLINELHPEHDPETNAVHSCGHNCQSAAMIGLAHALKRPNALDGMSGKIMLCAVPAEELIENNYRQELVDRGIIKYTTGKPEFLRRGYLDDVDIGFIFHAGAASETTLGLVKGYNGSTSKTVIFKGVSAHAAFTDMMPGVNALYAASQAMSACNALRENFANGVKWHPILTEGGGAVNAIPDKVVMESMVRGPSLADISKANDAMNRAIAGSAASIGATAHVNDQLGYAPMECDQNLHKVILEAFSDVCPDAPKSNMPIYAGGSGDIAFLSEVMSATQISIAGGCVGTMHGTDFFVTDPELACILPAKCECAFMWYLLKDDAKAAKEIKAAKDATKKSKEDCMKEWDSFSQDRELVLIDTEAKRIEINY